MGGPARPRQRPQRVDRRQPAARTPQNDPVALADQAAVAAGRHGRRVSSGDAGPINNIGSPATTPGIIAVGGTTTYRVYRQTTRYGTQLVAGRLGEQQHHRAELGRHRPSSTPTPSTSSRRVTAAGRCAAATPRRSSAAPTSTTAPTRRRSGRPAARARPRRETSGTAALVIQAYEKTHSGALPSPALVKRIIVSTATDLGAPADHQGAGLVNTLKAVQLAESIDGGANQRPARCSSTRQSLNATVNAGQSHTFTVARHQRGRRAADGHARRSRPPDARSSTDTGAVDAQPRVADVHRRRGQHRLLRAAHVHRSRPGADYLNGDITWNAASQSDGGVRDAVRPAGPRRRRTRCSAPTTAASATSRSASRAPARGRR